MATFAVSGMACNVCRTKVEKALAGLAALDWMLAFRFPFQLPKVAASIIEEV